MMVTIAQYAFPHLARIALARLETEGIVAELENEHTVNADWLLAQAVGGIRLKVPAEQIDRARAVLNQDYSAIIDAADPNADIEDAPETSQPTPDQIRRLKAELARELMYHGVMTGISQALLWLMMVGAALLVLQADHVQGWLFWALWGFLVAGLMVLAAGRGGNEESKNGS